MLTNGPAPEKLDAEPPRADLHTGLTTAAGGRPYHHPMSAVAERNGTPRPIDLAVVAVVLALVLVGTANIDVDADNRPMDALAYACGVVGTLSLLLWRRAVVVVAAVVAVTTAVYAARNYAGGPALLPGPLALLALGYSTSRRVAWTGAAGYVVVAVLARLLLGNADFAELLVLVGWSSAAVLGGQAIAARGERAAVDRERQRHAREQAVAAERLRIARDLHDSVAHAMTTINVQAGVAAHLLDRDAGQAKGALEAIRGASSDVLDELTAILSVLRASSAVEGVNDRAPRSPLGTLADLHELAERARTDGLEVDVDVHGDVAQLPPSISAVGYRVVQEALTNTRRHAGSTAHAAVVVDVGSAVGLSIQVRDDGGRDRQATAVPATAGFGLMGMRERVEATGGSLRAEPRRSGGFEVIAAWGDRQ